MVRSLVADALTTRGFTVVAVESARRAIREFDAIDPDVLVADIDLGSVPNGVQLAKLLYAQAPYLGVVFLTNYPSLASVECTRDDLPKVSIVQKAAIDGPDVLFAAIEAALDDRAEPVVMVGDDTNDPLRRLSAAQLALLRLIAEGWSNAQIAERRGIAPRSAERIIGRVFAALGIAGDGDLNQRVTATRLYIRTFGVPEPPPRRGA